VFSIIERRNELLDKPVEKVYFVYDAYQNAFKTFAEKNPGVEFLSEFDDTIELKDSLIIFDD